MSLAFEFATATRIVFGAGKVNEAPAALAALGATQVLVVSGRRADRAAALAQAFVDFARKRLAP